MRAGGVKPPEQIPMIVITRGQSFGIPGAIGQRLDAAWFEGQGKAERGLLNKWSHMREGYTPNKLIVLLMLTAFMSVCTAVVLVVHHQGDGSKHVKLPDPFQSVAGK